MNIQNSLDLKISYFKIHTTRQQQLQAYEAAGSFLQNKKNYLLGIPSPIGH
jgi:hypothetical protein